MIMKWPGWKQKDRSEETERDSSRAGSALEDLPEKPVESVPPPVQKPIEKPVVEAKPPEQKASPSGQADERSRDRQLYKALMASLYDAILIVDEKGNVIGCNQRAETFLDQPEAELWGRPCSELITGFSSLVLTKISAHVSSGRFTVLNANCIRKDGSLFPAEIAISQIQYLNPTDMLLSIRSLERRKKAEARRDVELEACKATSVGLMVCNTDGLIEYVNPACLRLLGYDALDKMLRHFLGDFCEALKATEQMLKAPSEQASWAGRATFRSGKGAPVDCNVTSAFIPPQKDGGARVVISLVPVLQHTRSITSTSQIHTDSSADAGSVREV